jgi:hypothetical protein
MPPVKLKAYILFTPIFDTYVQTLNGLSNIISFFQFQNVFNQQNSPGLPASVTEVAMEMVNQTQEEQNQLWGMLGRSVEPSVLFRLRTTVIDEETYVEAVRIKKEEIQIDVEPKEP